MTVLTGFRCNLFQYCTGAGRTESDHQDKPRFPGALNSCYTEKLEFDDPEDGGVIPVYRVMDRNGQVFEEALDPKVFISLFLFLCSKKRQIVLHKTLSTLRCQILNTCSQVSSPSGVLENKGI